MASRSVSAILVSIILCAACAGRVDDPPPPSDDGPACAEKLVYDGQHYVPACDPPTQPAPTCTVLLRHTNDGNHYLYACPEGVEPPCSPARLVDGLYTCEVGS